MGNHQKTADNTGVKQSGFFFMLKFAAAALLCASFALPAHPYLISYKEQYYRLFHVHYQQYPDDVMENIFWLEKASKAAFCNPQYALAKIKDKTDWEKYRYLFMMHINLKLAEQHLRLGRTWDKQVAYFYDAPWKEEYLRDLATAETCYKTGLYYWSEAKKYAEQAQDGKFRFLFLTDVQYWEDERERIAAGTLDYEKIITRELERLNKVQEDFIAMDENTY
ncbi:MAG: hypothetical protein NC041_03315 [Bacteroides sp.]|nr:hypothetical protein [Prevotella sp.]MCM1469478.1 hypothetical protein [Bacteroides sp.]